MNSETITLVIGVGGFFFGVFTYFTSGILKDKKQIIEHDIEIRNLKEDIAELRRIIENGHRHNF